MILLIGGEGFIGKHFNIECISYDLKTGSDILNKYDLESAFADNHIDTVIHLAAYPGVLKSLVCPEAYIDTNIKGTMNVIDACKRHKVKHLIFFSSSSVYGNGNSPLKETDALNPVSPYGITKVAGELLVKSSGVPYTIIRPFSAYGTEGRKDQIFYKWIDQIKKRGEITLFGDGTAQRGFTNVNDIVDAVMLCLKKGAENETYNIGGGEVVTINQIIATLKQHFTFTVKQEEEKEGDIRVSWADISKAKEKLGYKPKNNFFGYLKEIIKINK